MRKASMIALCGLVAIYITETAAAASAQTRRQEASASVKHTTPPMVGTVHMKLLARISPPLPEHSFREGATGLVTDGGRWAAYEPVLGTTRLIDTMNGRSVDRPDPEGCAGGLAAAGDGELLYECEDPECPNSARFCMTPISKSVEPLYWSRRYVAQDIESGSNHIVAGTSHFTLPPKEGFFLTEIGANWIFGGVLSSNYHEHVTFFLNWRTGRVVQPTHMPKAFWNLNAEGLTQPVCAPLRWTSGNFLFASEGPFAVTGIELPEPGPQGTRSKPLRLLRCGSHSEEILTGRTPPSSSSVQLGGGVVSWVGSAVISEKTFGSSETMYMTRLHSRGRPWHGRDYRLAIPKPAHRDISLQHTSTEVFVSASTVGKPTEVYFARIPKSK